MDRYNRRSRLTRRTFGALTAGGIAAALIPSVIAQSTTAPTKKRSSPRTRRPRIARNPTQAELEAKVAPQLPTSPADQKHAQEIALAVKALVLKGLLNRVDARRYPIPTDRNSPETLVAQSLRQVPNRVFQRIRPRLADQRLLARLDPGLSRIRFTEPRLELLRNRQFIRPDLSNFYVPPPPGPVFPLAGGWDPGPQQPPTDLSALEPPAYNNIIAELISLRCITETSGPGSDEIILGAIVVGADGRPTAFPAFVANGNDGFDDGTWVSYGAQPMAYLPLNVTPGYPKDLYICWTLVESDSDDQEVADGVNIALNAVAAGVGVFNVGAGAVIAIIANAINGIVGLFIDEDPFPPMTVPIRLSNLTQFGNTGVSEVFKTDQIKQDDGAYSVYYRWKLTS